MNSVCNSDVKCVDSKFNRKYTKRSSERSLELHLKQTSRSRRNEMISQIRRELSESPTITKSVRDVLVPKKNASEVDNRKQKSRKRLSLQELILMQKERLRIRFGTEVKMEQYNDSEKHMNYETEQMNKKEKIISEKFMQFEQYIQNQNETTCEAVLEAENWYRRRQRSSAPFRLLHLQAISIKGEITKKEDRMAILEDLKTFVAVVFYNSISTLAKPLTISAFQQYPPSIKFMERMEFSEKPDYFAISYPREDKTQFWKFDPQDVVTEMEKLEDGTLRSIEHCILSSNDLEDTIKGQLQLAHKYEMEIKGLKTQINMCEAEANRQFERAEELAFMVRMFTSCDSNGLFSGEDQLRSLKRRIRRLYNEVIDESTVEIEIDTLNMLISIEARVLNLIYVEETMDAATVALGQRKIEFNRKLELLELKNQEAERLRQERLKNRMDRLSHFKAKKGRKLMKRSYCDQAKINKDDDLVVTNDDSDDEYFFSKYF